MFLLRWLIKLEIVVEVDLIVIFDSLGSSEHSKQEHEVRVGRVEG